MLSKRQREVLTNVSHGLKAKEIAAKFGISESAIKDELQRIRVILGAKSTIHAVAEALRRKLIV